MVGLLLGAGCDPNVANTVTGERPIHYAGRERSMGAYLDHVRLLMGADGFDIAASDAAGNSLLHVSHVLIELADMAIAYDWVRIWCVGQWWGGGAVLGGVFVFGGNMAGGVGLFLCVYNHHLRLRPRATL